MLEPLDCCRRDPTFLQSTSRRLGSMESPNRLLVHIDEHPDFALCAADRVAGHLGPDAPLCSQAP